MLPKQTNNKPKLHRNLIRQTNRNGNKQKERLDQEQVLHTRSFLELDFSLECFSPWSIYKIKLARGLVSLTRRLWTKISLSQENIV